MEFFDLDDDCLTIGVHRLTNGSEVMCLELGETYFYAKEQQALQIAEHLQRWANRNNDIAKPKDLCLQGTHLYLHVQPQIDSEYFEIDIECPSENIGDLLLLTIKEAQELRTLIDNWLRSVGSDCV